MDNLALFELFSFEYLSDFLSHQSGVALYLAIAAMLLGGALGLPIPEDVPLLLAGVFIHQGRADMVWMALVVYVSILVGDLIIFGFGYYFGANLFKLSFFRKRLSEERARKVQKRLEKHAIWVIFLARHLFYLRSVTFLTCGALRMSIVQFVWADALAALVSVPIMMTLGYVASDQIQGLLENVDDAKTTALVVTALGLIAFLAVYYYRKRWKRQPLPDSSDEQNGSVTEDQVGSENVSEGIER